MNDTAFSTRWHTDPPPEPGRYLVRAEFNGREDTYIAYWSCGRWTSYAFPTFELDVTGWLPLPTP